MAKRFLWVVFAVLAVIGALTAGALIFITSSAGARYISEKLHETFRQQADMEVEFANLDIQFFPPRLMLESLRAEGIAFEAGCTVEEAEVSPDPLDLLQGRLTIEEIFLGAPNCRVRLDAAAVQKLQQGSTKSEQKLTRLDLSFLPSFDVVAMSNGQFELVIDDPDNLGNLEAKIEGLHLDITGKSDKADHIEVRMLLEDASAQYARGDFVIDERISQLDLRAGVAEDGINIRHVRGQLMGADFNTRNVAIPIPMEQGSLSAGFVSFNMPLPLVNRLGLNAPVLQGQLGFTGSTSVRLHEDKVPDVVVKGHVALSNGQVDDFIIGSLDGDVVYNNRGITFSDTVLDIGDGRILMDGALALDDRLSIEADIELKELELARVLDNVTVTNPFVQQKMTGPIHVKGQLNELQLKGRLNVDVSDHRTFDAGYRDVAKNTLVSVPNANVRGNFDVNLKRFVGSNFVVTRNDSKINADLRFGFGEKDGWRLNARSDRMNLADVGRVAGFNIGGTGTLNCKIVDRNYANPVIDGQFDMDHMHFSGFDFSNVRSGVHYQGDTLTFSDTHVRSRKSKYSTPEAVLDFGARGGLAVTSEVDIERAELADLARSYHLDTRNWGAPEGYVTGKIKLAYNARPETFDVSADLTHEGLTLFNEVFGKGAIVASYEAGHLNVEQLDMRKGRGKVALSGDMTPEGDMNFTGIVTDLQIEDIGHPLINDLEVQGTGQIFAVLRGNVEHPEGSASVRLSNTKHLGMSYGPTELQFELDDTMLFARGTVGDRNLRLEHAMVDFDAQRFEVEAFVADLNILKLLSEDVSSDTYARLTGELALRGRTTGDVDLSGEARFFEVGFGQGNFSFENDSTLAIDLNKGVVRVNKTGFKGNGVKFDVDGEVSAERINLAMRGHAGLELLGGWVDFITYSEGDFNFDVFLTGDVENFSIKGKADVKQGMLNIDGFPDRLKNINGDIRFGGGRIRFNDFSGQTAGGSFDLGGFVAHKGLDILDYDFDLFVTNVKVILMDGLSIKASTSKNGLNVKPDSKRDLPSVTGDVDIERFRYTEPIQILDVTDLDVTQKNRRTRRPKLYDKSNDSFIYDINLHGSRNLGIINNLLDARFRIDDTEKPLRIVGTNQQFGFLGRVVAKSGDVLLWGGKTFELRTADIEFKDPTRPENPSFHVVADMEIRNWRITATAIGTADEYKVTLRSTPSLSNEDIVFLMLTDMTKEETEQSGNAIPFQPILDVLSGGRNEIPVKLEVYSEESESGDGSTTRVALSRELANDVWVRVSSGIGQEQAVEGSLTYKINENFSVSANYDNKNETSDRGNWGVDLKFRLEF